MTDREALKAEAGAVAVDRFVRSGMRLGLGSGSTALAMLDALGSRLREGALEDIVGVPSSTATAARCMEVGIPLAKLAELRELDVTIDGADEIDPNVDLIKGLGGAHLREKVVAVAARRMIVVADESKLVDRLGRGAPLPVEVIEFARPVAERLLRAGGWVPTLRARPDGPVFVTDEGNRIFDCRRDDWSDLPALARVVAEIPGVVGHGLFLGIASAAVIASPNGVRVLERAAASA